MTHAIGTIREFRTSNFHIIVDAIEDDDLDLSWDDDGSVRNDLNSGNLIAFCARVRVFCQGNEISSDYLGGCVYSNLDAFQDHKGIRQYARQVSQEHGSPVVVGSYFSDMVRNAISEARATLRELQTIRVR